MQPSLAARVAATLRDVPDFPKPGILFKDIAPILADPQLLLDVIAAMSDPFMHRDITHVVGIESRGFLFGVPVAISLGVAFAPARKPGRLPWTSVREPFSLEYGEDALEMHTDALSAGARVLIVDDVFATGGTVAAAARLIRRLGGTVAGVSVLAAIDGLRDETVLEGRAVQAVVLV
jgi:adenine phosphoribosyltransferase